MSSEILGTDFPDVEMELGAVPKKVFLSNVLRSKQLRKVFYDMRKFDSALLTSADWFEKTNTADGDNSFHYPTTSPSLNALNQIIAVEAVQLQVIGQEPDGGLIPSIWFKLMQGRFVIRMSNVEIVNIPLEKMLSYSSSPNFVTYSMDSTATGLALHRVWGGEDKAFKFKDQFVILGGNLQYTTYFPGLVCNTNNLYLRLVLFAYYLHDLKKYAIPSVRTTTVAAAPVVKKTTALTSRR